MKHRSILQALVAGMAMLVAGPGVAQAPSIEGTYKLVSRTLPDGKVQRPPEAIGLMSFSKTHRNMNIIWKDAAGKHFSLSQVSTYKLAGGEYSETMLYRVLSDQIGGKEIVYDLAAKTASSPVKVDGKRLQFKFPLEAPTGTFDGDRLTATTPNGLVAVWEKVQ